MTVEHELATAGLGLSPPVPAASRPGDHAQRSLPVLQTQQARGLLPDDYPGALRDFQQRYAHPAAEVATWSQQGGPITLADVVTNANPTMLIGTSTQSGAFTEPIVRHMGSTRGSAHHHAAVHPTSNAEAVPEDLIRWTHGRALVATGSPFPPVNHGGRSHCRR